MTRIGLQAGVLIACGVSAAASGWAQFASLDRLSYKLEQPMPLAGSGSPTRMSLYHEYPSSLTRFRLSSGTNLFEVRQDPPIIELFKPTEIQTVSLFIRPRLEVEGDVFALPLEVSAAELAPGLTFTISVPLTPEGARRLQGEMAVPVGEIEVNVRRFANLHYYVWLGLTLAVIALLIWRKRRAA